MYPYKIYPYESVCANYTLYQPVNCVIFMDYLAASILDIYWKYTPTQTDGYLAPNIAKLSSSCQAQYK